MPARDQRPTNVRYYRRNRAQEIQRVRQRQDAARDMLRRLRSVPCVDRGGEFAAYQMDFDHRDPSRKSFRSTSGAGLLAPTSRVLNEIAKCDVVCANCHRIRTRSRPVRRRAPRQSASRSLTRKRRYWRAQARTLEELKAVPCYDCGGRFPACAMDFDHRDPSTKRYTVSRMIGRSAA